MKKSKMNISELFFLDFLDMVMNHDGNSSWESNEGPPVYNVKNRG